jgi:DivIVA domain-containing protein
MAEEESAQSDQRESELEPSKPEQGDSFSDLELRVQVPAEIRDASFPLEVRGYSRRAVDAYIERVNHLIAQLEMSRSPRAAVQHALDRLTEQVGGILQRARETAEEITSSAREEAKETTARAGAEAAALLVNASDEADRTRAEAAEILTKARAEVDQILARTRAEAEETLTRSRAEAEERLQRSEKEFAVLQELAEARMRELHADTGTVWTRRRELLDDMGGLAAQLEEAAREAAARFPSLEPAQRAEEAMLEPAAAEPDPTGVAAADEPTGAMPAVVPHEGRHDQAPNEEPV